MNDIKVGMRVQNIKDKRIRQVTSVSAEKFGIDGAGNNQTPHKWALKF